MFTINRLINLLSSIRVKFLLTIVILVMSIASIITFFWYSRTTEDAESSAVAYISELLHMSNSNFEVALRDINLIVANASINKDNVINILSSKPADEKELLKNNRTMDNYITSLYGYKYYLNGITIGDFEGYCFYSGSKVDYNIISKKPWFKDIVNLESGKIIIPPHYNSPNENNDSSYSEMVLSIAAPVKDVNKTVGFVLADIKCDILLDIFNINLKNKGSVIVFDSESDNFIFKPEPVGSIPSFTDTDINNMFDKINSEQGSFFTTFKGKDILVIYEHSKFTGWHTICAIPKINLLSGFYSTRNTVLVMSFVFSITAALICLLLLSVLIRNILRLNNAMKQIDQNNLNISVVITSRDEIGQLYNQFASMISRIKNLVNDIKRTESEKRKSEIKALQAQINPHFLYNTLNTIKFLASLKGADNIQKISESLSTLLHINMGKRDFITIAEEIEYLKSYISIQDYKYGNKFESGISVEVGLENFMVLKLLLQPLVENAIVHGFTANKESGMISIKIYRENDTVKVRVHDTGTGISESRIKEIYRETIEDEGIGLQNVISRIKLFFGDMYGLQIFSEQNIYTIVEVTLPLIGPDEVENYV